MAFVLVVAPHARAQQALPCSQLLSAAAMKKATGQPLEVVDSVMRGVGTSECTWMARGATGFKTAMITLVDPEALKKAELTPAQQFATSVKATEEVSGKKHEVLSGVGVQAALILNDQQTVTYLETSAGFVTLLTTGLTRPQVVAVAKAIAQAPVPSAAAAPQGGPSVEVRVEGAAIMTHPVGKLAVEFARLLHAGKTAERLALSSQGARDRRQAMPASEQRESDAYVAKTIPAAAALEAAIRAGGVLLVNGAKATLNVTSSESRKNADGSVTASASTMAMPFEQEKGVWKVAQ
jgi:hypothetical protein